MKKLLGITSLMAYLLAVPVFADDGDLPEASVDVNLTFASNYVWRGYDMYANKFSQDGKAYGAFNTAGSFQPEITLNTPVEGLFVDIWGAFAMTGRSDVDTDQALQLQPGGTDILVPTYISLPNGVSPTLGSSLQAIYNTLPASIVTAGGMDAYFNSFNYQGGFPGFYKEQNGLHRVDEVDLTIGYERATSVGTMGFGIVTYTYSNPVSKGSAATEMYVSYALPMLPQLSLTMYNDIATSNQYYNLGYSDSLDLGTNISFDYGLSAGYAVIANFQGLQDITASVGITTGGFSLSLNAANRPNIHIMDSAISGDTAPGWVAAWMDGGSTAFDGLVPDPSQTNGITNRLINNYIGGILGGANPNFSYTPRTKLPSTIFWVSAGYTISI